MNRNNPNGWVFEMNVLILGGNSDIGLAIAQTFAEKEKAQIVLASRDEEELKRNASDLSIRYGAEVRTCYFDACDIASHKKFYHDLPLKVDGVVIAFGYNGDQKLAENNQDELKQVIDTNYMGAASILEIIAADFEQRTSSDGRVPFIIGISSVAGDRGRKKNYIYGSAKAGFTAYLSGLRQRLNRKNVRVITVKPGFVDTKMTREMDLPGLLLLRPEQVADKTFKALKKGKDVTYITWYWRGILAAINILPEQLFKKLDL